ncbi:hypothetical protein HYALB_00009908 [Hymenoscyphus albidus]|uniref:Uncharacterized protein n=1 Tax=Hymenoscyphus albidus TaxID=595503 RepID=A0A9N9Q9H9_9HELO|nr:hypothetical protein HYALB_00009908 [Hymenoscyphus albidus]
MTFLSDHDIEKGVAVNPAELRVIANSSPNHDGSSNSNNQNHDVERNDSSGKKSSCCSINLKGIWSIEARGITRVENAEKKSPRPLHDYFHMFSLWFSINLGAVNIIIGLLGPLVYGLGWVDCICIIIFGGGLASCSVSYLATFGPESGLRSMILGRYFMGYWPSKIAALCNIVQQVGFGTIGCIVTGQMITAVNGGGLSLAVGCVIAALFGYIPQALAIFVLIDSAGKNFNIDAVSVGDPASINANRCSFFALIFASIIGFSAVRVGIATGVPNVPEWSEAYEISSGALLYACFSGLGGFGGFCVVIISLGSITNNAPCSYSAALTIQTLGEYPKRVPRWLWCVVITAIELVLSVAGRDRLFTVFQNFLPMMAYWICPWITIVLEEHLLFHKLLGRPFDWSINENRKKLPVGIAATLSFLIGFSGAFVGMYQVWYTGPLALKIGGEYGGDIGEWIAIGFTGVVFPPLRWLELKRLGR